MPALLLRGAHWLDTSPPRGYNVVRRSCHTATYGGVCLGGSSALVLVGGIKGLPSPLTSKDIELEALSPVQSAIL